jgi:hypothetical protein
MTNPLIGDGHSTDNSTPPHLLILHDCLIFVMLVIVLYLIIDMKFSALYDLKVGTLC